MSPAQLRLVIDSIVWAFRHTERNVADTGLCLLLELLAMFARSDFATQFHQTYYLQLVQEIFAVMTGARARPARLAAGGAWPAGAFGQEAPGEGLCAARCHAVAVLAPAESLCRPVRTCLQG
jgi:hypothetical protein